MAPARHNLTRRALLGAGVGACALPAAAACGNGAADPFFSFGPGSAGPEPAEGSKPSLPSQERRALRQAQGERAAEDRDLRARWSRALAACRRAEARVAAFKAAEAQLPAERRAFPACAPLEEEYGRLDSLRLAALRRLLRHPAPDLAALSLKLDLAVADSAWELDGCETCLEAMAADARRLAAGASA